MDMEVRLNDIFGLWEEYSSFNRIIMNINDSVLGNEVAEYVRDHLIDELKKLNSYKTQDYEQCLVEIYLHLDRQLRTPAVKRKLKDYQVNKDSAASMFGGSSDEIAFNAGCTACSALITPTQIIVANSGDSRCVLAKRNGTKYTAVDLSVDHKPDLPSEKQRIERAGGFVEDSRVKGVLALSRALGDLEYK